MTTLGQFCLLAALVGSGYAAFAVPAARGNRAFRCTGVAGAVTAAMALTAAMAMLSWALVVKDFRFACVAEYSSRELPWYYSLSACWVGQAGSLLLWAWLMAMLMLVFRFGSRGDRSPRAQRAASVLHSNRDDVAFGLVAAYLCFLVALMVFGADPMEPSLGNPTDGAGLGPLLQHPVMLIHPPVVFLGYACYAFPFALAIAGLLTGPLDAGLPQNMRSWALAGWTVLGAGILLGADWAYEELGWGGYWGWDPVENGSLIPWLMGTALVHTSMAWRRQGGLKKSTLLLAIATLGLCNFAAFVTRSGIFSSIHEFSRSPIGWMFLVLFAVLATAGTILLFVRRRSLAADRPIGSIWARESLVVLSGTALVVLASVALLGTLAAPLSDMIFHRKIVFGPEFYNTALVPIGLLLLTATALAPLFRWNRVPSAAQRRALAVSIGVGVATTVVSVTMGVRHPIALSVAGIAGLAVAGSIAAIAIDVREQARNTDFRRSPERLWISVLRNRRRTYAGYLIHAGFACLAIGVTGSSLGTAKLDAYLDEGETAEWGGRSIRFARLIQRELPDKTILEAELEIASSDGPVCVLRPAQQYYRTHGQWTTEVAIHATWAEDFYAVVHGGKARSRIHFTFVVNPMMRWLWLGGWIAGIGAIVGLLPARRRPIERQSHVSPSLEGLGNLFGSEAERARRGQCAA